MNVKTILITSVILVGVFIVYLYAQPFEVSTSQQANPAIDSYTANNPNSKNTNDEVQLSGIATDDTVDQLNEKTETNENVQQQDDIDGELTNEAQVKNPPFTAEEFSDSESMVAQFVADNNEIQEKGLARAFSYPRFSRFVSKLNELEKTATDYDHEYKLNDWLQSNFELDNNYTNLSCISRICALEISNIDGLDKSKLEGISEFGSFYSFMHYGTGDDLQNSFRAIYVQTDDSSSLTINKQ